jgi:hypothetical protein
MSFIVVTALAAGIGVFARVLATSRAGAPSAQ